MEGRRRGLAALCALSTAALAAAPAAAAPGDLDPSFSGDGKVTATQGVGFVARAVAIQDDGRILVAGHTCEPGPSGNGICYEDGNSSFRLVRYTPDGGLDPEFGVGGGVTFAPGAARAQAFDVHLQPDGRIVVAGVARSPSGRDAFALVRFLPSGALDPTFGAGGERLTEVGTGFAAISDVARGPGETIVAVGQGQDGDGVRRAAVARYSADGQLDASFGSGGVTFAGEWPYGYALGVHVAADGVVTTAGIAGRSAAPEDYRLGELRLTSGGTPDTSFARSGGMELAIGSSYSYANAIVGLGDGRTLAVGTATEPGGRAALALVRTAVDGTPDTSFDGDGAALVPIDQAAVASDVALDAEGRAVVAGQSAPSADEVRFVVARVDAAGRPDAAFGSGGVVRTAWDSGVARATAVAIQPDGRIVVGGLQCLGGAGPQCLGGTTRLALARYLAAAGPTPSATPRPSTPRPGTDRDPPGIRVRGVSFLMRRATLLRRGGITARVSLDEPATTRIELLGRTPRRRQAVLASRRVRFTAAGTKRARLRIRRTYVRSRRRFNLTLRIRAADAAGNTFTLRRTIRVR